MKEESPLSASVATGASKVRLREVEAKSILNKSGIAAWTVNCYSGCQHGCIYCYARFATRFTHPGEAWGSFVDVKTNAPRVLERQARRSRVGRVFISSVCDGWQPAEKKYGLTRECLEILLRYGYPVTILSKSSLARRDLDVISKGSQVDFGVTVTTLDDGLRQIFEPRSSAAAERLAVLAEAKGRGVKTHAFLGPLLPGLSDTAQELAALMRAVKEVGADYFWVDRLNPRYGVWQTLRAIVCKHFPHLTSEYQKLFFEARAREEYSRRLAATLIRVAAREGVAGKMRLGFCPLTT